MNEDEDRTNVKVSAINFAYDNYELIALLRARGAAITSLDFDKMRLLQNQLKEMVKDHDMYVKLTRPVCAFITFESDDGYNEALSYSKKGWLSKVTSSDETATSANILGRPAKFTAATEPTNIIWENRHIKGVNLYMRGVIAVILISMMLTIAFVVILVSKYAAIENSRMFANIKCDEYKEDLMKSFSFNPNI